MITSKSCPVDGSDASIAAVLKETERFAEISGLTGKDALHLRLLSEELLGVASGVAEIRDGIFEIEKSWGVYKLQLAAEVSPMGQEAKDRLLRTASSGSNELYQGVSGKLRMVLDWFSSGAEISDVNSAYIDQGLVSSLSASDWSLEQMRQSLKRDQKAGEWDELERSVLARLADDVRIGMRYGKISITVIKAFLNAD